MLQDHYLASGTVDLRCWLSCFDDPGLAASVGYPLGLSPAEVHRLFGAHPGDELTFGFEVLLPGTVTSSDASGHAGGSGLVWSPVLGKTTHHCRFEQDREPPAYPCPRWRPLAQERSWCRSPASYLPVASGVGAAAEPRSQAKRQVLVTGRR